MRLSEAANSTEISVGFRSGWVRTLAISVGGIGMAGVAWGFLSPAPSQPAQVFELLSHWGFVWLLSLAAMVLAWDLLKVGLGYLGKLADSVQESAVAMNRIADRDDRERDRMITETAYVGEQMQNVVAALKDLKAQNDRIEQSLRVRG
jgi:hypothetical protein